MTLSHSGGPRDGAVVNIYFDTFRGPIFSSGLISTLPSKRSNFSLLLSLAMESANEPWHSTINGRFLQWLKPKMLGGLIVPSGHKCDVRAIIVDNVSATLSKPDILNEFAKVNKTVKESVKIALHENCRVLCPICVGGKFMEVLQYLSPVKLGHNNDPYYSAEWARATMYA